MHLLRCICFRASGEAILGTQRYLENKIELFLNMQFLRFCFVRASGEAILGTQR